MMRVQLSPIVLLVACHIDLPLPPPLSVYQTDSSLSVEFQATSHVPEVAASMWYLRQGDHRRLSCGVSGSQPTEVHVLVSWHDEALNMLNLPSVSSYEGDRTLLRYMNEVDGTWVAAVEEDGSAVYTHGLYVVLDFAPTGARCVVSQPTGLGGCSGTGCYNMGDT